MKLVKVEKVAVGRSLSLTLQNLFSFDLIFYFGIVVSAPFIEEMVNRGIAYDLAKSLPEWQRFLVCVLPWALTHVAVGGPIHVFTAFVSGIFYFMLRRQTGSFVYSAIAHGLSNAIAVLFVIGKQ